MLKPRRDLTPWAGGRAGTLDFHAGNNPIALCRAPVFNPAKLAIAKKSRRRHCRPVPQMRPPHISISKYKRPGRLRFNFRGSQPPPESLNRSEFAGLKSAACGSPPRRAYRPYRRCGRVAEGGGLLNRYRVVKPYRGFESLRLRQPLIARARRAAMKPNRSGTAPGCEQHRRAGFLRSLDIFRHPITSSPIVSRSTPLFCSPFLRLMRPGQHSQPQRHRSGEP
jgi:hypothetical protein